jgi:hypothetical protein
VLITAASFGFSENRCRGASARFDAWTGPAGLESTLT